MPVKKASEAEKDLDGFVIGTDIDNATLGRLQLERDEYANRVASLNNQLKIKDDILNALIPNGVAVRCGRCKNRFYTRNLYGWLQDDLLCPFCNVRVHSQTFRLYPKEVDVSRDNLLNSLVAFMRLFVIFRSEYEKAGEKNLEMDAYFNDLARRITDMGFKI